MVRPMPRYRYYFLDSADQVTATDLIQCDTDAEAQAHAERLLARPEAAAIEVWDGARCVRQIRKPA